MAEEPRETGKVTDGDRVMGGRIVYGYGSVQGGTDAVHAYLWDYCLIVCFYLL